MKHLERHAAPGAEVRILDVGAGPLTSVGKRWPGRTVTITPVDALAREYDRLLREAGVVPLVRTVYAEAEQLTGRFLTDWFDLVCCQNALDHMVDPLLAVQQMLEVVKPGHAVVLLHVVNQAENQSYAGLHQWNVCVEGDEVIVWNKRERFSLTLMVRAKARIVVEPCWDDKLLLVSLTKTRHPTSTYPTWSGGRPFTRHR